MFRGTIIKVLLFNISDKIHNSQENLQVSEVWMLLFIMIF